MTGCTPSSTLSSLNLIKGALLKSDLMGIFFGLRTTYARNEHSVWKIKQPRERKVEKSSVWKHPGDGCSAIRTTSAPFHFTWLVCGHFLSSRTTYWEKSPITPALRTMFPLLPSVLLSCLVYWGRGWLGVPTGIWPERWLAWQASALDWHSFLTSTSAASLGASAL